MPFFMIHSWLIVRGLATRQIIAEGGLKKRRSDEATERRRENDVKSGKKQQRLRGEHVFHHALADCKRASEAPARC
jgi:hypothetical protein